MVVIAGQRQFIDDSLAAAQEYKEDLRSKGCLLITLVLDENDEVSAQQIAQPEEVLHMDSMRSHVTTRLCVDAVQCFDCRMTCAGEQHLY